MQGGQGTAAGSGEIKTVAIVKYKDARVKSLKPRCACTGVVLRLSDPPDMSIKVERQLHDMRILGRIVGCCVPVAHV